MERIERRPVLAFDEGVSDVWNDGMNMKCKFQFEVEPVIVAFITTYVLYVL